MYHGNMANYGRGRNVPPYKQKMLAAIMIMIWDDHVEEIIMMTEIAEKKISIGSH